MAENRPLSNLAARYDRATLVSGPKSSFVATGDVDGYWLSENCFFFFPEPCRTKDGISIPLIADANRGDICEAISPEALAQILRGDLPRKSKQTDLKCSQFDMIDEFTLGVSACGHDYNIDLRSRKIVARAASLDVPALYSPDGRFACFLMAENLWLKERSSGLERPLITQTDTSLIGQLSETALCAVSNRRNPRPVGRWSPDSRWFLTHKIDESSLPELPLIEYAPAGDPRPYLHRFRYSFPGDVLPRITPIAINVLSGEIVVFDEYTMETSGPSPFAQNRIWFDTDSEASCIRVDRYSRRIELIRLDVTQRTSHVVLSEEVTSGFVDVNANPLSLPNIRPLRTTDEVIWFSERDGWGHLYLYDEKSNSTRQITKGDWLVRDIVHVDEQARKILFTNCHADPDIDPTWRALCAVNFDGTGLETLFADKGDIAVTPQGSAGMSQDRPFARVRSQGGVSPEGNHVVIYHMNVQAGNRTVIHNIGSTETHTLARSIPIDGERPPVSFTVMAADDRTRLHGVMFYPCDFSEAARYPLVAYIYPGPHCPHQPQSFQAASSAFARSLAEIGFVTIMLDTRGTPFGNRTFRLGTYGRLLEPQLADHAAAVRQLCEQHAFLDQNRVGIVGQSAGGAAAVRALLDYGDVFCAGVAASGTHDVKGYWTGWADKYCGPVTSGGSLYATNIDKATELTSSLFVLAGGMDENVNPAQTLQLADALVRANKDFEFLFVPQAGHQLLLTSGYAQRRAWDFLVRNLLDEKPPKEFHLNFDAEELMAFGYRLAREARR